MFIFIPSIFAIFQLYILYCRRGLYYKLEVKAPDNDGKDRLLTVSEIYSILEKIFEETEGKLNIFHYD